jgi:hypothetical protein
MQVWRSYLRLWIDSPRPRARYDSRRAGERFNRLDKVAPAMSMNRKPSPLLDARAEARLYLGKYTLRKELDACLTEVIDWQKQDLVPNPGYRKFGPFIARKIGMKSSLQLNCLG